ADPSVVVEGSSGVTKSAGQRPGVLVRRPRRGPWLGARAQGSRRNLGDLVASGAVGRNGERSEKPSEPGREKSERRNKSDEAGEPHPRDPAEQRAVSEHGAVDGKDERDTGLRSEHLNETATGSEVGARRAGASVQHARSSHRPRVDARGLSSHAQGWRNGGRRTERRAVRGANGGQPPRPPRARKVRRIPSAAGEAGPYPQGRWVADAAHRHSHVRG